MLLIQCVLLLCVGIHEGCHQSLCRPCAALVQSLPSLSPLPSQFLPYLDLVCVQFLSSSGPVPAQSRTNHHSLFWWVVHTAGLALSLATVAINLFHAPSMSAAGENASAWTREEFLWLPIGLFLFPLCFG